MNDAFIEFYILMLLSGIVLTVITIRRMCQGQIMLPLWAKFLLTIAMITMLVIILLGILPTQVVDVTITDGVIVTPLDPDTSVKAAP